ncbi:hypothetical protein F5887DRAFT_281993 [Amanita rubescens]|nr:hypothetical protein F5887DRAFT_281993 [Amanita rubescens]
MLTTLRLKCLIEGEVTVFPVTVAMRLKKSIQKERAPDSLKDVGPHTLELWKGHKTWESWGNRRAGNMEVHLALLVGSTSWRTPPHNCEGSGRW